MKVTSITGRFKDINGKHCEWLHTRNKAYLFKDGKIIAKVKYKPIIFKPTMFW